jgi:signal peptidase I
VLTVISLGPLFDTSRVRAFLLFFVVVLFASFIRLCRCQVNTIYNTSMLHKNNEVTNSNTK